MATISPTARLAGGPTIVLEYAGLRLVTDPTFDPPGEYPVGRRVLTKIVGPGFALEGIGPIDAVLLSHHQHPDNLDRSGRELLGAVPLTLTTPSSAGALGGTARGLEPWESTTLFGEGNRATTLTAVPARHGPAGCEPLTGEVTGFVLSSDGAPTVYVSGDNAALEFVAEIAGRLGPIDVAVLFAGGAKTPLLGDAFLTLSSAMAAEAARTLDAPIVVPAHFSGWAHFTEGPETLRPAFEAAGVAGRLVLLEPGQAATLLP